jgi:hypothetical protein
MKTGTALWAFATVVLGCTTLYLAYELHVERGRAQSMARAVGARINDDRGLAASEAASRLPSPQAAPVPSATQSDSKPQTLKEPMTSSTGTASSANVPADLLERARAHRERRAKQLADPVSRALFVQEERAKLPWQYPGLATALGLSAEDEEKMLSLLTRHRLEMQDWSVQRRPGDSADSSEILRRQKQEITDLLGYDKSQKYERYEMTMPERQQLRALRARLDEASPLKEEQATRLVEAMYQERSRYIEELLQSPDAGGYGLDYPITAFPKNMDAASQLTFAEAQMSHTEDFVQRMHGIAATVLTPAQLRRFDQLQEFQLTSERANVERLREQTAHK